MRRFVRPALTSAGAAVVTAGGDCENEYNGYDAIGHRDDDALEAIARADFESEAPPRANHTHWLIAC